MNKAIVTDVRYRMSLTIIRSLGRKNIPVISAEYKSTPYKSALGFFSRYTSKDLFIDCTPGQHSCFVDEILKLVKSDSSLGGTAPNSDSKPVLIPVGLDSLIAVAKNQDLLKPYTNFIVPDLESIEIANDTNKLIIIASDLGIPCPLTTTLQSGESIETLSQRISYPAVIKYREGEVLKFKPEKRYKIIKNSEEFIKTFEVMHNIQPFPIVQNYISGQGFGVSAVFDNAGNPLEVFCHRRIREYPVSGGPSCFCESIWDDRLVNYSIKLLKALNWKGVAMVEFKGDLNGQISLMEINPRFWGSLPLSLAAKCDIPYAYYRAANGELSSSDTSVWYTGRYNLGKKMRFLLQDLLSVPGYLKSRDDKLAFLAKYILELLNPRISEGVFEFRDWRPSLRYFIQALGKRKKG